MKSKINKFFAWIIVLLLVLGLVGFGLQDVLSRWGSSKLATVGDIEISTKEFGQDFIREINFISQNLGKNLSVQEAKSIGIHFRVLERLINRSLLDQLVRDLEISIGDTFLLKRIKCDPIRGRLTLSFLPLRCRWADDVTKELGKSPSIPNQSNEK